MKLIITLCFCSLILISAQSQPGSLDKSFGTNGVVLTGDKVNYCFALAVQTDGKIIQAGGGSYKDKAGFLMIRFDKDGNIDGSFGIDGRVVTDLPGDEETIFALATQPDGKILASGYMIRDNNTVDIALVRYYNNGAVDSSFGENGVVIDNLKMDDYVTAMALQADGKIILTGITFSEADHGDNKTSFLLRYTPDGNYDQGFGENGKVFTTFNQSIKIGAVSILADDAILTGGTYNYIGNPQFLLVKYNGDGTINQTFGENGIATAGFNAGYGGAFLNALTVQNDGKITAAGKTSIANKSMMALMRFNSNGMLDNTFGKEGKISTDFGTHNSEAKTLLEQHDSKIIAAGRYYDNISFSYFALSRYLIDGSLDSAFGKNGLQVNNMGGNGGVKAGDLQEDGKILLAGDVFISGLPANIKFALARYNGGDVVLATEFAHFEAHQNSFGVLLNWQAAVPENESFIVERSGTGVPFFKEISKIDGTGISRGYNFTDRSPLPGVNFYRIKHADADENFSYSSVLQVNFIAATTVKLFPNPVNDILTVTGLSSTEASILSIYDVQGKLLQQAVSNTNGYSFSLNNFIPGNYLLRVTINGIVSTHKFIKK